MVTTVESREEGESLQTSPLHSDHKENISDKQNTAKYLRTRVEKVAGDTWRHLETVLTVDNV